VKATPTSLRHRGDIPELTGLRFLAAFSVMAAHGIDVTFKTTSAGHLFGLTKFWLSTAAGIGMPLFFVLSGFVIHYNYRSLISSAGAVGFAKSFARCTPHVGCSSTTDLIVTC
jgi:peptidoglycan/LPS O-acetylase OafA/YrhL